MSADPYAELAEIAERALALSERADPTAPAERAGEPAALSELLDRATALAATLPATPPASARPALERAASAQERLRARLSSALAATRATLERTDRSRQAAGAYAPSADPALFDSSA